MIKTKKLAAVICFAVLLISGAVLAQIYTARAGSFGRGGRGGIDPGFTGGRGGGRRNQGYTNQRNMGRGGGRGGLNRQYLDSSQNLLTWEIDPEFKDDVFTFVRIAYNGSPGRGGFGGRGRQGGFGGGGSSRWRTDYPDSDNNFSFRLHQVTSIEVNPQPVVLELTSPELSNYPFIYMVEPGSLYLNANEAKILRDYLLNGGFLMLDDFWGNEWYNVYAQMKKVFPEREPVPLTLDHPIFHSVFEIKEFPQIPAIDVAVDRRTDTLTGRTSESGYPASFWGIYDDKGRMMVIIDRDTDLGDGWEREGMSQTYFKEFSEKKAYPMGINIIFYALTH